MQPSDTDRIKVFVWRPEGGEPLVELTNDAGDEREEFGFIDDLDEPTARRLVACWNACRGIETRQLEVVASYAADHARLSWLGWSAHMAEQQAATADTE